MNNALGEPTSPLRNFREPGRECGQGRRERLMYAAEGGLGERGGTGGVLQGGRYLLRETD